MEFVTVVRERVLAPSWDELAHQVAGKPEAVVQVLDLVTEKIADEQWFGSFAAMVARAAQRVVDAERITEQFSPAPLGNAEGIQLSRAERRRLARGNRDR